MNWTPDSVLALTKHKQSRPLWLDLLLHSIINFVRKQSLIFCQYQVSCVESSFDQLTKPTGLTGVLVDLRSRKFSSMTSKLVQSCHSTLSSNRIIYQRLLSKIMGASSQYRANLEGKFTVDSRPTDTSPLRRELQWNASRNDWIRLPFLPRTQAITEVRTLSCHPAKHFTCLFSRYRGHLNTSSKILTHIMQSDTTIKENTETILQLAANMRISCLRPNLYPVRDATRETLCLRSHILFHMFRDQITYFLCYYPAITDSRNYEHKISPRGFCNNGSRV